MPLAKVEIVIPAGVIKEDAQEDPTLVKNGKVDISVTTFVPAPKNSARIETNNHTKFLKRCFII
jgi:hypothetical protein